MIEGCGYRPDFRGAEEPDPKVLLAYGQQLELCTVDRIIRAAGATWWRDDEPKKMRGKIGTLVEAYFNLKGEAKAHRPDFVAAGVELKTLPVLAGSRVDWKIKEPTSISDINYCSLVTETWENAVVRQKLDHILFVVVEMNLKDLRRSIVRAVRLWRPTVDDLEVFRRDWEVSKATVEALMLSGDLIDPSQTIGLALAPRRKATDTREFVLKDCGDGNYRAKRRAFALKPAFTRRIVLEWLRSYHFVSVRQALRAAGRKSTIEAFESAVIEKMAPHQGRTIKSIAEELAIEASTAKDLAARVVRSFLGATQAKDRIKEFEEFGILVRVLNLKTDENEAFEGVSFPQVTLAESSPDTEFEDSEFAQSIQRVLFIPTHSSQRKTPQFTRRLGLPFFWSPSEDEWEGIEKEWRMFMAEIADGKAVYATPPGRSRRRDGLTKESQTKYIHVRPHADDASDTEPDPLGNETTRRCFWLNKGFVQRIVDESVRMVGR